MIHKTPPIDGTLQDQLQELEGLRGQLRAETRAPGRWLGSLRRLVRARAADSSVSIEGYHVSPEGARAILAGTQLPLDDRATNSDLALICYGRAMDHAVAMADDPGFRWSDRVIKDLHFDACYFQSDVRPGRWRSGPITVKSGSTVVYEGPEARDVPALMDEVVGWLQEGDTDAPVVVRAAMAHLHIVSVHPFRDGNGRISRIVQSLVLARDKMLAPEFTSIEEYLGEHTDAYYVALEKAHGAVYDPTLSAREWVEFCVMAHLDQARRRLAEIQRAEARWNRLDNLVAGRGWNERLTIALEQALHGIVTNALYRAEADVSEVVARNDFRRLVDAGLLIQVGRGRVTGYSASDALRALEAVQPTPVRGHTSPQTVTIHAFQSAPPTEADTANSTPPDR